MNSIKCLQCGLVNFAEAETCKRCGETLLTARQYEYQRQLNTAEVASAPPYMPMLPQQAFVPPLPVATPLPPNFVPITHANTQAVNSTKMFLGFTGSALLMLGAFVPLVSVPIIGSINYFRNGQGDGVIIVVLAFIALLFTLARYHRVTGAIGLLCLGLTGYSFFTIQSRLSNIKTNYELDMAGNAYSDVGRTMLDNVNMEWGWAVLLIGGLLLIVSSELPGERSRH